MHEFIYGSKYPYNAYWEKRNPPLTVDGTTTYEGAVPFTYRKVKNQSIKEQEINGLKQVKYYKTIRTRESLNIVAKDRILIDNKQYEVKDAYEVDDDKYDSARMLFKNIEEYEMEIILDGWKRYWEIVFRSS